MIATAAPGRPPAIRLTAQQRRDAIVEAAVHEFARSGFDGTPAAAVAARAGVSQPLLFKMFGTKRNLFIATVKLGSERIRGVLVRAAAKDGERDALNGVHAALLSLLQERTLLLLQLHAFAACNDLNIRAATRAEFEETRRTLASASRAPGPALRSLLAEQAMLTVAAAMDFPEARS